MKLSGIVQKGAGRGQRLGFPTANIPVQRKLADGIYLAKVLDKPALVFIGAAETFGENSRKLEAYILDFDGDLYGQELEIELIEKLRDNKKFDSAEELVEQMKEDEKLAREYFKL